MPAAIDRRQFLVLGVVSGGGLIVGCSPLDPRERGERPPVADQAVQTSTAKSGVSLNAWLRITREGQVVVALPRSEMGQGVHTALAMMVAEELEVPWAQVGVESAPAGRVYANTAALHAILPLQPDDEGWVASAARWALSQSAMMLSLNITGGSTSVRAAWEPMRWAGASAREVLKATAAREWKVPAGECEAVQGKIRHARSSRELGYGELAALWAQRPVQPPSDLQLRHRRQWRVIGTSPGRLDTPAKVRGKADFGTDISRPGLLRAALRTCPYQGGRLGKVEAAKARALPGVREVLEFPDWPVPAVAVVAEHTWQALKAAQALEITWDSGLNSAVGIDAQRQTMSRLLNEESGLKFRNLGDAAGQLAAAGSVLEADYEVPYLAHAVMEPLNATARFADGRLELWAGTQTPILARWRAAQIAGIGIDRVNLQVPYLGGGFGRRLETDVIEQATHLALKMPGIPVQLLWTREQDLQHDVYRPAAMARLRAAMVQPAGLAALHIKVVAPSVSDAVFRRLFPPSLTDPLPVMPDKGQIEGAYDLPYGIAHLVAEQVLCPSVLPIGYWRSVGHSYNAFFTECFLDEVAQALKQDPLSWRMQLLAQRPRHQAVLKAVGELARWTEPPPPGRARGLALHESFGAICAQVAEVSLEQGRPKVHRILCALDAGTVVHPDSVRAQVEGSIAFGLSAALWGQVPMSEGRVALQGWADHPVVKLADMPQIETVLIDSTRPPAGVGEPATPPVAPAVVNALARLEGQRRRRLPLIERPG